MDILDKKIEELNEADFPSGLHGRIMRRVAFLRFRAPMLTILAVLAFNVAVSGWRVWTAARESEMFSILGSFMTGFEISASFLKDVFRAVYDIMPIWSFSILLVNIVLAAYVVWLYFALRRLAPRV